MDQMLLDQANEYGFDAKLSNEDRLIKYVKFGNIPGVKKILEQDLDINYKNDMGFTALMYASIIGNLDIIKLLLQKGANIDIKNNSGLTARDLARFNGNRQEYGYLCEDKSINSMQYFKMGNVKFETTNKYSPFDILKNVIYCENPVTGTKLVNSIDKDITLYSDYRIQMMIAYIALNILDNNGKDTLEIFISNDNNIVSITGNPFFKDLKGLINIKKNIIQISAQGEFAHATRTLLHELIHKIHNTLPMKDIEKLRKCTKKFRAIAYLIKNRASKDWIRKNILDRIKEKDYDNEEEKLEEIIADMGNATIYANGLKKALMPKITKDLEKGYVLNSSGHLHQEITQNMNMVKDEILQDIQDASKCILFALTPLQDYFDTVMMPQMASYILKSPYLKNLLISDELKTKLRQFKCKNLINDNIYIKSTPDKIENRTKIFFE